MPSGVQYKYRGYKHFSVSIEWFNICTLVRTSCLLTTCWQLILVSNYHWNIIYHVKRPRTHWLATSNDGLDTAPYAPTCLGDCTWYVGWTTLCNQTVQAASYTVLPHHLVQDFHDTCLGSPTPKCQFCNHLKYYSCDTIPTENKVKLHILLSCKYLGIQEIRHTFHSSIHLHGV
jgi:hypothetical protein